MENRVLYSSSCNPLSLSPPHSPLTIVRLFLTSISLVILCLLFLLLIMVQLKVRSASLFLKSLSGCSHAVLSHCPAFHTHHLSKKSSLSQSWLAVALLHHFLVQIVSLSLSGILWHPLGWCLLLQLRMCH